MEQEPPPVTTTRSSFEFLFTFNLFSESALVSCLTVCRTTAEKHLSLSPIPFLLQGPWLMANQFFFPRSQCLSAVICWQIAEFFTSAFFSIMFLFGIHRLPWHTTSVHNPPFWACEVSDEACTWSKGQLQVDDCIVAWSSATSAVRLAMAFLISSPTVSCFNLVQRWQQKGSGDCLTTCSG